MINNHSLFISGLTPSSENSIQYKTRLYKYVLSAHTSISANQTLFGECLTFINNFIHHLNSRSYFPRSIHYFL